MRNGRAMRREKGLQEWCHAIWPRRETADVTAHRGTLALGADE
jgi:hypothetical protein